MRKSGVKEIGERNRGRTYDIQFDLVSHNYGCACRVKDWSTHGDTQCLHSFPLPITFYLLMHTKSPNAIGYFIGTKNLSKFSVHVFTIIQVT